MLQIKLRYISKGESDAALSLGRISAAHRYLTLQYIFSSRKLLRELHFIRNERNTDINLHILVCWVFLYLPPFKGQTLQIM